MKLLRHPLLHTALALVLGGVFVYASLDKIAKPADFARIIYHYQLVGPSQSLPPLVPNSLAVTLPFVELLAGLLLIAGVWRREAAALSALMLVAFIGAVSLALWRGIDISNCGCFSVGADGRRAGLSLILADTALLAAALLLSLIRPDRAAASAPAPGPASIEAPEQARLTDPEKPA